MSLIDLYPSLNDYCRLQAEPNKDKKLDGYSLKAFLQEPDTDTCDGQDVTISVVSSNIPVPLNMSTDKGLQHYSVRSKMYRYILCSNNEEELYDHETDLYEWHNAAYNYEYRHIKEYMNRRLVEIIGCR